MDTLLAIAAVFLIGAAVWLLAPLLPWWGLIAAGIALVVLVPGAIGVVAGIIQRRS